MKQIVQRKNWDKDMKLKIIRSKLYPDSFLVKIVEKKSRSQISLSFDGNNLSGYKVVFIIL